MYPHSVLEPCDFIVTLIRQCFTTASLSHTSGPGGQGTVTLRARLLRFSDHLLHRLTSDGVAIPHPGGPADPQAEAIIEQGLATAAVTNQVGSFTEQVSHSHVVQGMKRCSLCG
jgi:hypothetical protein